MKRAGNDFPPPCFLGVECGGTKTSAVLIDDQDLPIGEATLGPANLRLVTDAQLIRLLQAVRHALLHQRQPTGIVIGMAGARTTQDRQRITEAAARVWPGVPCRATHDLETALAAVETDCRGTQSARVLIVSGTGSCCYGRTGSREIKVGGWGHLLGDRGSGYAIGMNAVRAAICVLDRTGRWPGLGSRLLRALQCNEPEQLIAWAQTASKNAVASVAAEVFAAAHAGDATARRVIATAAETLAADGLACIRQVSNPRQPVDVVLAGGVFANQPQFVRRVGQLLRSGRRGVRVTVLRRSGAFGAAKLARTLGGVRKACIDHPPTSPVPPVMTSPIPTSTRLSPTEERNPRSTDLDRLNLSAAVELMLSEDSRMLVAVCRKREAIVKAVRLVNKAFRSGGRLFYVGAGTSGRLGVLDASECPPTFRVEPDLVQGIIAGGQGALWRSIEGAEDDAEAGGRAVRFRGVRRGDVVVGIAASGRTPFVWGALREAKRLRAKTALVCFNPHLRFARGMRPDVVIDPDTGPEILTGSTRLKAGTATKIILNLLTTLAMVRQGKVLGNLMVDLNPSNAKLRDRAVRIVCDATGVDATAARNALELSRWDVRRACVGLRRRGAGLQSPRHNVT